MSSLKDYPNRKFQQLEDGRWFTRDDGKYGSGLIFVLEDGQSPSDFTYSEDPYILNNFNIVFDGTPSYLKGTYGTNANEMDIFIPSKPDAEIYTHVLVRVSWGGQNNPTRGIIDNMISERSSVDVTISKYCPSNNGKMGCTYFLVPKGFRNAISYDEL